METLKLITAELEVLKQEARAASAPAVQRPPFLSESANVKDIGASP